MFFKQIYCTGRRYPNAPSVARVGSQRRGPPAIFIANLAGFTGVFADMNGFANRCYWQTLESLPVIDWWHMGNRWRNGNNVLQAPKTIDVRTKWDTMLLKWYLELECVQGGFGQQHRKWRLVFDDGFPVWPTAYTLTHASQTPFWTSGGEATQSVFVGHYSQIPPNSCYGPEDWPGHGA